ncbi:hypothetical protein BDFB_014673 [Asbolus verrucosus]|uniref:Tf2-1-like SH3-like domain-containing protein n=1 Tax=Asbolus verrucosus TaxID=1661398 RepID=A0A482VYC0_ASBVE|nr:hypothetical protein BDFB_014673 [Asbolus verrucosus]
MKFTIKSGKNSNNWPKSGSDNKRATSHNLEIDDWVLLRNKPTSSTEDKICGKFLPLYSGPYVVIAKPHPNTYQLANPVIKEVRGVFNMSNLKLYHKGSTDSKEQ